VWDTNGASTQVILTLLFGFFMSSLGFTMVETMAAPVMQDHFGTSVSSSSLLFFVGGAASVLSFLVIFFLNKYWKTANGDPVVNPRQQAIFSMVMSCMGALLLTDFQSLQEDPCSQFSCSWEIGGETCAPELTADPCSASATCGWNPTLADCGADCPPVCYNPALQMAPEQLFGGFALINLAFPVGRVGIASFYSQLLQSKKKQSGLMQGLLVATGSLARIAGPLFSVALYASQDHRTYLLMTIMAALYALTARALVRLYGTMQQELDQCRDEAALPYAIAITQDAERASLALRVSEKDAVAL
jgi:MFS family permease